MKSIHNFIVHIPNRYNETFKTESGLEMYGDSRWSAKEMANTIVKVIEIPCNYKGIIQKGFEVLIDPTVVFNQVYQKTGVAESHHLIDKEKGLYRVEPSLIILYRKDAEEDWRGHDTNLIAERIKEEEVPEEKSSIIFLPSEKPTHKKGEVKVVYGNRTLEVQGVFDGDTVYVTDLYGVDFFMDGKKYVWFRTNYVNALKESYVA